MRQPYPIAREAFPYLIFLGIITVLVAFWSFWAALVPLTLFLFTAFFFRNPKRQIPTDPELILSPADGRVMVVEEVDEKRFLNGKAIRVSIFLSVFNVHLNRCPIAGTIAYTAFEKGQMLPAYKPEAAKLNEKNFIGIENNNFRVLVVQISGLIARTIVSWVKTGDKVAKGEIYGLIKFGSCTEIYFPASCEVLVKPGDKVVGGITAVGRIKNA